jgi:broad specificity phosphatase PhoE
MTLTFMRHPPIDGGGERCIGQTDVGLSPAGWAALAPLAERACRLRPDRVLCSDLQRCQLLGEAIAARLGLAAEPNPIWREVNFGAWENRTWSDIRVREPRVLGEWLADFDKASPPGGESFQQLQARVLLAIGDMGVSPVDSNFNTGGTPVSQPHYLVVTHAGVIRAAVSAFSGTPLRYAFEWAVPYGSLTSFHWDGTQWSPVAFALARENHPVGVAARSLQATGTLVPGGTR